LHDGAETMLNTSDEHVLSWLRKADSGEAVVVACNFSLTSRRPSASICQGREFTGRM
jgi:hypothetical protein